VEGPVFVQPAPDPHPIVSATLEAARSLGIPTFDGPNGRMMEGEGGCSVMDVLIRNARRKSIFRANTFPYMGRPNLTVLTQSQVIKVTFEGRRATGVEFVYGGKHFRVEAGREIVLSLGAANTPKVLMHSGIGDQSALPCKTRVTRASRLSSLWGHSGKIYRSSNTASSAMVSK
jgi:choline dehydrogenase